MADMSDVASALKAIIVGAIYPNGTAQPSAMLQGATPLASAVMRGWPQKEELHQDLKAGRVVVSIWKRPGERNTTRSGREWQELTAATRTIEATLDAEAGSITLTGTVSTPQNVAAIVNGKVYVHPVQPSDTLAIIAAGLAAQISEDLPASSAGAVLTIEGVASIEARVGGAGTLIRELSRQEGQWQVIVWASTPDARDAAGGFIDGVLKGKGQPNGLDRIMLADGYAAHLRNVGGIEDDDAQAHGVYRRDIIVSIEYATTETTTAAAEIIFAGASVSVGEEAPTQVEIEDADADALFAAMDVAPSDVRKARIKVLIAALKAAGVWSKLDLLYMLAAHDAQAARLNWINPATFTATEIDGPVFTTDRGYATDGAASVLSFGWRPIDGVKLQRNSASIGGWCVANGSWINAPLSLSGSAVGFSINPRHAEQGMPSVRVNQVAQRYGAPPIADARGFVSASRTGQLELMIYRNGVLIGAPSEGSDGLKEGTLSLGVSDTTFAAAQFALVFAGAALTTQQHADAHTAFRAFLYALGAI